MRFWSITLLLCLLSLGCNRAEEAKRRALQENLKRVERSLQNYRNDPEAMVPADAREPQDQAAMDVAGVTDASNRLALDLYQQLRSEEGNLFFSPSSISMALAMVYAGAAGETEAEMAATLHFQMPGERLHEGMQTFRKFAESLDEKSGARLSIANRLWSQESYEFLPPFLQVTGEKYDAELARLDFAQREQARETINGWVEDQTEGKIVGLMPSGAITPDTKLVLTNAIYFHGVWAEPFKKERTQEEDFHVTATEKVRVPMMHRSDAFGHAAVEDLQVLELPYGDGSLSMFVLLPNEVDGLASLEAELSFENLQRWMDSVQRAGEVKVYLPRFKTTTEFELSNTLRAMGMVQAFDPKVSDFSGMTTGEDLVISAVIHKAFVDVNEEGTEAAAATGVAVAAAAMADPPEPLVFRADHPFVFMIRDNRTHAILFLGRITNPLK